MTSVNTLSDNDARRDAISSLDRSILVEAGAGSGKTAIMAGRIVVMLAQGVAPRSIAAVTFTELAASELLLRVREFVNDLVVGHIAPEISAGLPDKLSAAQQQNLISAATTIDEITCSTIHGFCQRLIKPYPAEANIDPGATVIDGDQADLNFREITDGWLRERLSGDQGGVLAEMVLHSPDDTITLMRKIVEALRRSRNLVGPDAILSVDHLHAFQKVTEQFSVFLNDADVSEPETEVIAKAFSEMVEELPTDLQVTTPAGLVELLVTPQRPGLFKKAGGFYAYRKKGKWETAAKEAGLSKADGARLNDRASGFYGACTSAWTTLLHEVSGKILATLIDEARAITDRYREYKRASAQLDFDDLIYAARDLLRDHETVRQALGQRYSRVLVDEFQDTDPLQAEIFWRLCGDPGDDPDDWTSFQIRPGALFLVGDPKQAIYRFRGADVGAYVQARTAFSTQAVDGLVSISTNFRSCASILTFVNKRFEAVLSSGGQPGFTHLDPYLNDPDDGACIAAIDIAVSDENDVPSADQQRDAEADAVAELCARLIGSHPVLDRKAREKRPCQPGDIALLAPTGTKLWRYEEALERHGIPVATQAGKGLYRRQEVQDLIAITRTLADRRDILALGALLRGPLVGLREEDILDIVWALPRSAEDLNRIPRLDLGVDPAEIIHPEARDVIKRLQALQKRANSTTPHDLLSQAVDVLRVRPILLARHRGQAERALANIDLYLSLANGYAVRGLRAFSEAMTSAWTEETRAVEGRPDAQEEAVALYTMHAAKGLEWPIVIPINTMTKVTAPDSAVVDRQTDTFYCPVLGVDPFGYDEARQSEMDELDRERIRLWYVTTTRARELLVLPRLDQAPTKATWINLVDLSLPDLTALDVSDLPLDPITVTSDNLNDQTRESFAAEAGTITERQMRLTWLTPSRDDTATGSVLQDEQPAILARPDDGSAPVVETPVSIQGGRERGLILHKLMEEVLTGECAEFDEALIERADGLIRSLGKEPSSDQADGLSPDELASCVIRTLALPEVAALRPSLLAEFPIYTLQQEDAELTATVGIADALAVGPEGRPSVVIDWKSDVNPTQETLDHYRAQVSTYLKMTNTDRGLIVLMTSGTEIVVRRSTSV